MAQPGPVGEPAMFRTFLLVAATIIVSLVPLSAPVHASCPVIAASLGEHYDNAEVVFIGRAIDVTPVQAMVDDVNGKRMMTEKHTRFEVIEILKGAPADRLLTKTEYGRHDCHFEFTPGSHYIVFAHRERRDGSLRVGLGGPTALLANAGAALVYCRRVTATGKGPSLIGTVWSRMPSAELGMDEYPRGVPGAVASIDVNGVRREVQTDANGVYYFEDLPLGSYSIRLSIPEGYRLLRSSDMPFTGRELPIVGDEFQFEIKDGVHAQAFFEVSNAGTLSGTLVDATGAPVSGVDILLVPKAKLNNLESANWTLRATTNDRGQIQTDTLPEDDYALIVNGYYVDAYVGKAPRFVYPPSDGASASKFAIVRNGRNADLGTIRMPPPFASVPLDIEVVSTKEYGMSCSIMCTSLDGAQMGHYFLLDDDGRVRIHLRAGLHFRIEVNLEDDEQSSGPVEIEAKPGLEPIRFEVRAAPPVEDDGDGE